jgi:hypothetical protein
VVSPPTEVDGLPVWALPESVQIALVDLAETAREGLLALAVGTGVQVMQVLMEEDVTAVAGPKGKWNPDRAAVRHGSDDGQVTVGGRRVAIRRPRVRSADGRRELPLASYELFSSTEILGRLAPNALHAEATLEAIARDLQHTHPGAAASLREGLAETLTVTRLGVPATLARTLRSTNAIESMIEIGRDHSTNVKRWRDGQMALRWCAAGLLEAKK